MIKEILQGLWKWIFWILIILILGALILAFRIFIIDKDYDGTFSKNKNSSDTINKSSSSNSFTSNKDGSFGQKVINGVSAVGDATVSGYKNDSDYTYNSTNFDERFLMYEGEQYEGKVNSVLELLIENSKDNFYARTSVTAVNFGNDVSIQYNGDVTEYQNAINNLKSYVSEGHYDISFKYGALGTYVNEIVITKK